MRRAASFPLLALWLAACAAPPEPAAEPFLEQTAIFEAGQGGYAHYRIPAIAISANGTILAFTEARKSTRGDWGTTDILMRRSRDGGRSWDEPRKAAHVEGEIQQNPAALEQGLAQPGEVTYNNFVPVADRRGETLHFVFCVEYARAYYMRSDDDGETFSDPVDITSTFEQFRPEYEWKVLATGPGHGIQLDNGRLLVPVWLSDGSGGHAHRPSVVAVIYSDDGGRTWERGDVVVRRPELVNPSETVAVQLADGRVMLNIRHESPEHRRAISYSDDGAADWTEPKLHPELLEPVCMASMTRLSRQPEAAKHRLLFANPHSDEPRDPDNPDGSRKRQNVTVKLSYDEGETWPVWKTLEPGPSGYSDLAVGPDGTIYCFYERGVGPQGGTGSLTVARFNLEWLTDGADSLNE
jgi:sialidase-1